MIRICRTVLIWLILLSCGSIVAAEHPETLSLATWNIRILSDGSRDNAELAQISAILRTYSFVAIQELRDSEVLDRLMAMLPGYSYVVSEPVGRNASSMERYAFVYRTDRVSVAAPPRTYPDRADWFIREPFVGHFRADQFDFTVVTVHALYGNCIAQRRSEIARLDDVIRWADELNGDEEDVLLVGDFNVDVADRAWEMEPWVGLVPPDTKTTISDASSYDNIWYNPTATTELLLGTYEVFKFDEELYGNDDDAAMLAVSDHRPVSIRFATSGPDDDGDVAAAIAVEGRASDAQPAGSKQLGAPEPSNALPGGSRDVGFLRVVAHPTADESVTLVNLGQGPVDLSGWRLGDLNDPLAYRIPEGTMLEPGGTHTFVHTTLPFGINNSGERLFLRDPGGIVVDEWRN